jgi:phosphoribosylanthranilate isomerase
MARAPLVKICGLTTLEDAEHAAESGAEMLGFVFHAASKRAADPEAVVYISRRLRLRPTPPLLVGVFVNEDPQVVAILLERCSLDMAQLSGDEPPAHVGDRASPLYGRSYKALRPLSLVEAESELEWYLAPQVMEGRPRLLLDTYHPQFPGGTGLRSDWDIAARISTVAPGMMLAGGLTPDNVAQAIRRVRPFGVDVASGVEASPGRKNPRLVEQFIRAARTALEPR